MGWTDSHLHQFEKDGKNWGVPEWDEFDEFDLIDENKTHLGKVLRLEGDSVTYLYDFGDAWQHEVVLEKIQRVEAALPYPICLGGERRCPPEDVGGVHGYQEFLEVILDPKHEQYEQLVRWAGGHFHDEFHPKTVNAKLSQCAGRFDIGTKNGRIQLGQLLDAPDTPYNHLGEQGSISAPMAQL